MKDAKGHGSERRGGSYHNINQNLRGPGKHVGYAAAGGVYHIQKSNGPKSGWYSANQQNGTDTFSGKGLGAISQGLQQRSDAGGASSPSPAVAIAQQHGIPTDHLKSDVTGGQMDAYVRFASGFTGAGQVKDRGKKNIGTEK